MSLKRKALLQLVGLIAFTAGVAISFDWVLTHVSPETIRNVFMSTVIGGLLYLCYEILLSRLESLETLNKIEQDLKK
jgi:hypothetical protein